VDKGTILIVEDELVVAQDLQDTLTALGFTVCGLARTGAEALQAAREQAPDLVLMDIRLEGGMDGTQAANRIKAELGLPIVFLTSYLDETAISQAKSSEPFGYLIKPFREKELQGTIEISLYKHQMQRRLKESEARYRRLVENAPALIFRLTLPLRRFEYVSPFAEYFSGYGPQAFIDQPELLRTIVHPAWRADFDRHWEATLIGAENEPFDYPVIHRNGGIRWWRQCNIPIPDAAGRCLAVEGLIIDVTNEQERHREFDSIIQTSLDGFWVVDVRNGTLLEVNDAYCQMIGYSREELLGQDLALVEAPETREDTIRHFSRPPRGGKQERFETRHRSKDGRMIAMEVSSTFDDLGEKNYVFLRDITERKRILEDLRQKTRHLQELTFRLGEIAEKERREISRDLHDQTGQNLTALGINLQILKNSLPANFPESMQSRLRDSIDLVDQTTHQLRNLVTQFRPPVLDDFGLVASLHGIAGQFKQRTGIPVEVSGGEITPRPAGPVENNLFRIVQEALNNAAKYARAQRVAITIRQTGNRISLSVSDDGIGFDPGHPERNGPGDRLGLLSMGERALALGGTCRIESEPGRGTRILVEVPAAL
jgi:PAS domain S-box-containing protein